MNAGRRARAILALVLALSFEFLLLFLVAPTAFAYTRHRIPAIPALWLLTAYCLWVLLRDPSFARSALWNPTPLRQSLPAILALFGFALVVGTALLLRFAPELFLNFPRTSPVLWGFVMVLYPVLSVYPQGVIYRAFVFHRYPALFGSPWTMVAASAAAFAYVHIVFRNPLAVGLTMLGGLLFGFRYWQTGSLLASSFEHALYGCAIFTIGLGRSFYHGAVQR